MAFIGLLVSACTGTLDPADTVRSSRMAIDIGRAACRGETGGKLFDELNPPWTWHAVLLDDKWRVWRQGDVRDDFIPEFQVYVAKQDGKASDCVWFIS